MFYFENYWIYEELVKKGSIDIYTKDINKDNIDKHFNSILNIMRDGIELDQVQQLKIHVYFTDNIDVSFTIFDYWFNTIFWTIPALSEMDISSNFLFFCENGITKSTIKSYIDNLFIDKFRSRLDFKTMNNIIDACIHKMKYINEFSLYLSNTLNFSDTIDLMNKYPEFNDAIHGNFDNVSIDDAQSVGMKYAKTQIDYIKNNDHHLRDAFIAGEGINPKQFKEVSSSIGIKPTGTGEVFPHIITNSFLNGGLNDLTSYMVESSVGRYAQILSKINVGTSGAFARLLDINNSDTSLHTDPNYSCDTKNFLKVTIEDDTWLRIYNMRYYRFDPNDKDKIINYKTDKFLIGKTILVRSPVTCASYARGEGICRKCYGDLYYINRDINVGKIAAESLSEKYTQILLSAKHILEAIVNTLSWNEPFNDYFTVDMNTLQLKYDEYPNNMCLKIKSDDIECESDDDDDLEYNDYITNIVISGKTDIEIHTIDADSIYITPDLAKLMRSKKTKIIDDTYYIPLNLVKELDQVFFVKIKNTEISKTLDRAKSIINKTKETSKYDKDSIVKEFISTNISGKINVDAIHMEVIISNQIRDKEDILDKPDWTIPNQEYTILTLSSALTNNPSITVSLQFQKIAATLISPLSTKKRKASMIDVFFMDKPQEYLDNTHNMSVHKEESMEEDVQPLMYRIDENGEKVPLV